MASDLQAAPTAVVGLSFAEAAARLGRGGPNALPTRRRLPVWRQVLTQPRDPLLLALGKAPSP